jgi:NAD(P)-dependent dehydrogenase (short-subunit alcohol dehydrogenase family)
MYMSQFLQNFNCVITGGTGALGQIIVTEFIKKGAKVTINYRNIDKYRALKENLSTPDNLFGIESDLITEESIRMFFGKYSAQNNRLDVFIHLIGGFWMGGEIADTPYEQWKYMLDLNLNSTFFAARAAFRVFKKQCSGKIFTVSAKSAIELPSGMGAYGVSKAAVLALSDIMAKEGKKYNIQVNSLLPSVIDTPANRKSMPDADYSNWVSPKHIADLLVTLSLPEAKILSQTALYLYGKL